MERQRAHENRVIEDRKCVQDLIFLKRIQDEDVEQKTIVHWQPKAKNLLDILTKKQKELEQGNEEDTLQKKKPRPYRLINGEVIVRPGKLEKVPVPAQSGFDGKTQSEEADHQN